MRDAHSRAGTYFVHGGKAGSMNRRINVGLVADEDQPNRIVLGSRPDGWKVDLLPA